MPSAIYSKMVRKMTYWSKWHLPTINFLLASCPVSPSPVWLHVAEIWANAASVASLHPR